MWLAIDTALLPDVIDHGAATLRWKAGWDVSVINDVRQKRGADDGRKQQPQRRPYGETPCCRENRPRYDVWNRGNGITMPETVQDAMGDEPNDTCEREEPEPGTSESAVRVIAQSRTCDVGDGRPNTDVEHDAHRTAVDTSRLDGNAAPCRGFSQSEYSSRPRMSAGRLPRSAFSA